NVYVLRQSPTGPLFLISQAGTIREIALPDHGGTINAALIAGGHLIVHYVQRTDDYRQKDLGVYSEYALDSMEKLADYKVEAGPLSSNNMPVCYERGQLTFLKIAPGGRLSILTANLK